MPVTLPLKGRNGRIILIYKIEIKIRKVLKGTKKNILG
jgi:hypothetical protein